MRLGLRRDVDGKRDAEALHGMPKAAGSTDTEGSVNEMCQCGCGEHPVEQAYELKKGCVLGVKIYDGCMECFQGLAVDLTVYNSPDVEWLQHLKKIDKTVKPNEYGGSNPACGIPIPIIDVQALQEQAEEIDIDAELLEYGSFADWLSDRGLEFLRSATRKFQNRHAEELRQLEKAVKRAQKTSPIKKRSAGKLRGK